MNKAFPLLAAAAILFTFSACSNSGAPVEEITPPPSETEIIEQPIAEPSPEPPAPTETPDGHLFMTVSEITLSVVGESEDIYVGTLPRDVVTWSSADESVATFENGILTATGVGSTTVFAEYGTLREEIKVSCLAATQEELLSLDMSVLRTAKRMPPVIENPPLEFFEDAVMVGDSITHIMFGYENTNNMLGDITFLTRGGSSVNGFVNSYWNIYYRGQEMNLEDILPLTEKKKLIIMLGQNDLGYRTVDQVFESWDILLERILEKSPDMEIYFQSCVPEWIDSKEDNAKNEKIDEYNIKLKAYAQEHGHHFIDVAPYAEDHLNRMPDAYNLDGAIHLNLDGCTSWMNLLRAYAAWQQFGG